MSKKIVITGGLGYIGTELCKIYSGISWNNEILVIDNRFISERVNQLRNWGINFIQGDILDYDLIKKHLSNCDVVHHLAGVTKVPRTSKESDENKNNKIHQVASEGTKNIINAIPNSCKIIFPSTHVVYEGVESSKKEISENESTSAFLAYAIGKVNNEEQIKNCGKKYVILRLGSVYGYSTDTTRLDIMPNLFSKIASQNGMIKLFSGGKQIKSLVPLLDVARCFRFMEKNESINSETFHVTKEAVTVKEVAEICKKNNSKIILRETNDEIPNLGYSLSNKKLLKTGFEFLYNLQESIKEMISKWSVQNINKDFEYIKKGEKEFVDKRGKISNHELPEPVNLVGYIESKKGTVRANHFHPIQEQKCILVKGQFISVYQDLLNDKTPKITHVVNEGDLIVTKPNIAHAMVFSKDSVFLNLVRGEREHENYGVTHTIRHVLVDDKEKKLLMSCYKFDCRTCGSLKLKRVVSLGYQPLANNLLKSKNSNCELYPLEMNYCEECHNCQLSVVVDPKKMFSNYLYLSSTSKSFKQHFEKAAHKYIDEFNLSPKRSYIIDVGSNDGIALKPFKNLNYKNILGIEPAKNLAKLANKEKIKTYNGFLDKKNPKENKKKC